MDAASYQKNLFGWDFSTVTDSSMSDLQALLKNTYHYHAYKLRIFKFY